MVLDMTTPKKKLPPALAARARAAAAMTPAQRAAWAKKMQAARNEKRTEPLRAGDDLSDTVLRVVPAKKNPPATNAEGLTWPEWKAAAGGSTVGTAEGMKAWKAGEDPSDWRAERGTYAPRAAKKNAPKGRGRAFIDYAPIARNPPAVVGEPYLDHLRAQRDKLIAKRATHRKNSAAWEAADNAVRAKAKELAQEMRAFYATVTADAEARTQRNPPKKTSAKKNTRKDNTYWSEVRLVWDRGWSWSAFRGDINADADDFRGIFGALPGSRDTSVESLIKELEKVLTPFPDRMKAPSLWVLNYSKDGWNWVL